MKETAEVEVPSVFEEVAPHDAAMSEIGAVVAINIAPNPVVTVEVAAIKIALTVVERARLVLPVWSAEKSVPH